MDKPITKKYTNGELTILWKPSLCVHSAVCWRGEHGLPEVFSPTEKPWIKPDGAQTDRIIEQIKKCPSGALSYFINQDGEEKETITSESIVETMPDGPLLVYGNLIVKDHHGTETRKSKVTAFCRCGASGNKPFCDGTHTKIGFKG